MSPGRGSHGRRIGFRTGVGLPLLGRLSGVSAAVQGKLSVLTVDRA